MYFWRIFSNHNQVKYSQKFRFGSEKEPYAIKILDCKQITIDVYVYVFFISYNDQIALMNVLTISKLIMKIMKFSYFQNLSITYFIL